MSERLAVDVDTMLAATRQVEELHEVRNVLDRHHLPTGDVDARIAWLVTAPADVTCFICCRRSVTVLGLAQAEPPACESCLRAACDEAYCFAPATVAITTVRGTRVWCTAHGFAGMPDHGRALIRHLTDAQARRDAADRRLTLGAA